MKEKMITRTIKTSFVKVMCVRVSTASVTTDDFKLVGAYNTEDALQVIKERFETDDYKPSAVMSITTEEHLLGMTESDFVKYAQVLPPRNVK